MPKLEVLAGEIGAQLADLVVPMLAELKAQIAASRITGTTIDQNGDLVLTFGDGTNRKAGRVVGRDGLDGRNGADGAAGLDGAPGLGFEDLDLNVLEDGRTLAIKFERGEVAETFELEFPVMIYRGVFEPGRDYRPGDSVTFGGSSWVCGAAATSERPGEGDGWTLAVKRGRDGKDLAGPQPKGPR